MGKFGKKDEETRKTLPMVQDIICSIYILRVSSRWKETLASVLKVVSSKCSVLLNGTLLVVVVVAIVGGIAVVDVKVSVVVRF